MGFKFIIGLDSLSGTVIFKFDKKLGFDGVLLAGTSALNLTPKLRFLMPGFGERDSGSKA